MRIASIVTMVSAAGLFSMAAGALPARAAPASAPNPAEVAAGKRAYLKCMACHAVTAAAPAKVGPTLFGVVGRTAGTLPGYRYSAALAAAKPVWTEGNLDKWLTRPASMVPGTAMAFAGVADPAERKALIAYLKSLK